MNQHGQHEYLFEGTSDNQQQRPAKKTFNKNGREVWFEETCGVDHVKIRKISEQKYAFQIYHKKTLLSFGEATTLEKCVVKALFTLDSERFERSVERNARNLCVSVCNFFGCSQPATVFAAENKQRCDKCGNRGYVRVSKGHALCEKHSGFVMNAFRDREDFEILGDPFGKKRKRSASL